MVHLAVETPGDVDEVEALYDLSFAPGRQALSSYQLRGGVAPVSELCLVARDDYWAVVGAIRFWPIEIAAEPPGASRWPGLLLGPVAVHPTRQGEGVGALLIFEALERAAAIGWSRVMLVGDEPYYGRFGFRRALARGVAFPAPTNPERVLARALSPGAMDGVAGRVRSWRAASADRGG